MRPCLSAWLLAVLLPGTAAAQAIHWQGYLDLRLVGASSERSWTDGGLGKTRFGRDGAGLHFGGAALAASWQLSPAWLAFAEVQAQADGEPRVDLMTAYVRYRPVSTTAWRGALKLGAFFPPVSLENDNIGWTSRWTLTPSAINSWVGEELRVLGAEARLEHRGESGRVEAAAAVFGRNSPAGELLASRGWAMGDATTGLAGRLRQPDVHAPSARTEAPFGFRPVTDIDGRLGWYAQLKWESPAWGQWSLMRYDNRADPEAWVRQEGRRLFAWRTRFWSLGAQARLGDVVLVAQAMDGSTAFEPVAGLYLDSRFDSAFLLAAWERPGAWQPALRLDRFRIRQLPAGRANALDEDGHALTLALNWRPRPWLRVTGEWLRIDSDRPQRRLEGRAARQRETQLQLSLRVLF